MPVLIWYSPEMVAWLQKYRPPEGAAAPAKIPPVPDGAIMIKEMYNSTPAAACRVPDLLKLKPVEQGAAVMVRDSAASQDGWFWGWYGWPNVNSGWTVDYPPSPANGLPFMGFGQYCLNCHASARDNQTFASLGNIKGEPGTFLSFLAQDFYQTQSFGTQSPPKALMLAQLAEPVFSEHLRILEARRLAAPRALLALPPANPDFMAALDLAGLPPVGQDQANLNMPSQTYEWTPANCVRS
jgi:Cytochrome P460